MNIRKTYIHECKASSNECKAFDECNVVVGLHS